MEFHSFGEMALHLAGRQIAMAEALHVGLELALQKIEKTAKSEFGTYQPAVGPFVAWAPLADTTLYGWGPFPGKVDLGYAPPDNPLVRTHHLQESITHEAHGLEGAVGSPDPVMAYQEFGDEHMPPRPVLGPAGFRNRATIQKLVGAAALSGLIGGDQVHRLLGYDMNSRDVL